MTQRVPGERCIGCRRTLNDVGGQRIVAALDVSVRIVDEGLEPSVEITGLLCPLFAKARAMRIVRSGGYPWVCQRCAGVALCPRCGSPFHSAPGADVLSDDGTVLHVALVAGMELDSYGRPGFSDDDINYLTPIVYAELHEDFKANPTLVVVGDGWVYCTAEFQRGWEEAIKRALVLAAAGEGEKGPSALVLKALLNRKMEREPDFYTLAGILCDQLVRHYEPWTGLPGMDRPWEARSQRTRQIWAASMRKALARTGLSSENPKPDDYRFFLPRKSDASTLLRFQIMELEAKRKIENDEKTEPPISTPSEQPPPPPSPARKPWWRFWRR